MSQGRKPPQRPGLPPWSPGPPGYSEVRAFNQGARAVGAAGPIRKMAQYAFTGAANPVSALPANFLRTYLIIQNVSAATNLFIGFGAGATDAQGLLILPNGGNLICDFACPTDEIYIWFTAGAAEKVIICEGVLQNLEG